jgi:uncharacterized membrane protein YoaK (UPF0700 family)
VVAFFLLAVVLGTFPDGDAPAALVTGFTGIAAMVIQNGVQRVYLSAIPATTLMTGNTTQATLDATDLLCAVDAEKTAVVRVRFFATVRSIFFFAAGCAIAAILYAWVGFWCLAVRVLVGAASAIARNED